ncbi:two-component sensor histidine kinase [Streptomyces sp. 3MP-14]|uniref:histidine kinase n=1 Tax=Streptomyces mimosae TaxID=2586635 RepID=A0A5N6A7C0_9ACTN|nr:MULTISPECIES: histidine kinase [Streptomyces]KAB8164551.1 two-component sensor histidine kinase [Streptomyces mimosae]KAB8175467.1 two-component sensor histidine kinase [Streptomyces sp. 3MP-14]
MPAPPRPHRHDLWIALAGLVTGLVAILFELYTFNPYQTSEVLRLPGLLVICAAEVWRRTLPRTALAVATAALVIDAFAGGSLPVLVMFTDVIYAAVLYGPARFGRAVVSGSTLFSAAGAVAVLAWLREPEALVLGAALFGISAAPSWTGLLLREYRDKAAAERLRAEQTALLAEMDRAQAVATERARMARELHDIVANHLSAIAIHSTAALSLGRPETNLEALHVIRENSTQGLTEMRRLIGLLRTSDAERPPEANPTLDGLDALLKRAAVGDASGALSFVGRDEREADLRLPAPVELAAYRIVQESLTNAVKHAAPGRVEVHLGHRDERLTVTVTSPYRQDTASRAPGTGSGLVGMAERVELLHGNFAAGPVNEPTGTSSWRVAAELPLVEGHSTA